MNRLSAILVASLAIPVVGLASEDRLEVNATMSLTAKQDTGFEVHRGEWIRVTAGGCAENRNYLQPFRQANQGLIWIPGVTTTFVPTAEIQDSPLRIDSGLAFPGRATIWIAYGSYHRAAIERHQDPLAPKKQVAPIGSPVPCGDRVAPKVVIERLETQPDIPEAAFDLSLSAYDLNLIPLNPKWMTPASDACTRCDGFSYKGETDTDGLRVLSRATCTHQFPYVDVGKCSVAGGYCDAHGRNFKGHVNWGPATFTGRLAVKAGTYRGYLNPDGDVEFLLKPDEKKILTAANGDHGEFPGVVGIEFASYETYQYFTKGWWSRFVYKKWFRTPVPVYTKAFGFDRHVAAEEDLTPGSIVQDSPVTIIGIFGLDNEHDAHPEIHPVYAMALKIKRTDGTATWPVFARNWATGGSCADRATDQRLDCSSISIRLPESRIPHDHVSAALWDQKGRGVSCRAFNDDVGVVVQVDLPTERNGLVYGEIKLVGAGVDPNVDANASVCPEGRMTDFRYGEPPRLSWQPSVYTTIITPRKSGPKP